ncbi:hypothetical protein ANN_23378 [Periplaneta americana]|uniref:Uncharacterized protein n=1 Tax=Periplaneta americana TaxID=6978 RepID=A0ABQ8SM88_PERAM|nr:hypothetical protein ANN_23378 [Periplaneta americana]
MRCLNAAGSGHRASMTLIVPATSYSSSEEEDFYDANEYNETPSSSASPTIYAVSRVSPFVIGYLTMLNFKVATGVAQSAKALVYLSRVPFGPGFHFRLAEAFPNRKAKQSSIVMPLLTPSEAQSGSLNSCLIIEVNKKENLCVHETSLDYFPPTNMLTIQTREVIFPLKSFRKIRVIA